MKRCSGLIAWVSVVCVALACDAAEIQLRVTGNRVHLRAAPERTAESVGQVSSGDILYTRKLDGEWVAVVPPPGVDLWVYAQLVKDETVAVPTLQVRSGPGINYRPVGLLTKGTQLAVRGERDDWLRIEPPEECVLWISRQYVKADEPAAPAVVSVPGPVARPAPAPSPRPASVPVKPATPQPATRVHPDPVPVQPPSPVRSVPAPVQPSAPRPVAERWSPVPPVHPSSESALPAIEERHAAKATPPPFDSDRIAMSEVQGRDVRLTGVLRRAPWVWRRPSLYRLVTYDQAGYAVTACYVRGGEVQLHANLGSRVTVCGSEHWLQGVRYPVVVLGN